MVSALVKEFDGGCAGSSGIYRVPLFHEILAQRIGHDWLVVYHKNSHLFVFHLLLLPGSRGSLRAHLVLLLHKECCSLGNYPDSGSCTTKRSSASFADPPWASIIFAAKAKRISSLPTNDRNGSWSIFCKPDHSILACRSLVADTEMVTGFASSPVWRFLIAAVEIHLKASVSFKGSKSP